MEVDHEAELDAALKALAVIREERVTWATVAAHTLSLTHDSRQPRCAMRLQQLRYIGIACSNTALFIGPSRVLWE
jgi:hypothetical protein